ncbi:MAG: cell envelope integrity EipB family protein [Alphaproteobacteria bacterium]
MRVIRAIATCALCGLAATPAMAQPGLVPHRAVYDIALDEASDRSGITAGRGRMVYEFNGSACEGYTVNFRFVTQIDTADVSRMTDQQTSTYEGPGGDSFDFVTKAYVDRALDREVKGRARLKDGATVVEIDKPVRSTVTLAATQFPTRHLEELIAKAEQGETFYETDLYDGSEDADRIMTTTVIIGQQDVTDQQDGEFPAAGAIEPARYWPVSIAYFDLSKGEELPDYRIDFKLHPNGITRDLVMDYGDFSMTGTLVGLALFGQPAGCEN